MQNWHKYIPLASSILLLTVTSQVPQERKVPTFNQDILPIVQTKCMPCHQQNGVGPFPLITFADYKKNLRLVKTMALSRAMPPMQVHSDFGEIATTPQLTNLEIVTFQHWINGGAPEGDPIDIPARPFKDFSLEAPDLILNSPSNLKTKVEGAPYWQVTAIPLGSKPIHITAFEIAPNSPKALRNAMIAIIPTSQANTSPYETSGDIPDQSAELIGVWSPGFPIWQLPTNATYTIPANSTLLVQSFFQPTGKAEDAGYRVAFKTEKQPGSKNLKSEVLANNKFTIEAGTNPTLSIGKALQNEIEIFALIPEARFYCTTISSTLTYPDQSVKTLLQTDRWNPYWRGNYVMPGTIRAPEKSTLLFQFNYANDESCPMNADKIPLDIQSGSGLDNELCKMHLFTIEPRAKG
ncbi:MAG: hypothetical protein KF824_08420 [Fimbriimonadaceae bacterium]|nr:MAG: hypothetical protein KF824_08420 [Fimbriimonadaceae bacterium]